MHEITVGQPKNVATRGTRFLSANVVTVVQPPDCEKLFLELIELFEIPPTTRLFSIESGM